MIPTAALPHPLGQPCQPAMSFRVTTPKPVLGRKFSVAVSVAGTRVATTFLRIHGTPGISQAAMMMTTEITIITTAATNLTPVWSGWVMPLILGVEFWNE